MTPSALSLARRALFPPRPGCKQKEEHSAVLPERSCHRPLAAVVLSALAGLLFSFPASCAEPPEEALVIAIQTDGRTSIEEPLLKASCERLNTLLFEMPILFREGTADEISEWVQRDEVHYAVVSPVVEAVLERHHGARALASERREKAENPVSSLAAALVVRLDHPSAKSAGARLPEVLYAAHPKSSIELALRRELLHLSLNHPKISVLPEGIDRTSVDFALARGTANGFFESALLPACFLERHPDPLWEKLRVLPLSENVPEDCAASSHFYPGWALTLIRPHPSIDAAAQITGALLTMPPAGGNLWSLPASYDDVKELLNVLHVPEYDAERWNFESFVKENWPWLAIAFLMLFSLLVHVARTETLIRRRTLELIRAVAEKDDLEARAKESSERVAALERTGLVGELSSALAHELKHPLAVIHNYARGIDRMLATQGSIQPDVLKKVVASIDEQSSRATAIVDHVRSYAKKQERKEEPVNLSLFLPELARRFSISKKVPVETHAESDLWVMASPLEIEVAVFNLLRNAAEAEVAPETEQKIFLTLESSGRNARIGIADCGVRLSDEAFAKLSMPLQSTKPGGLGLGLVIVRRITEVSHGKLSIERQAERGLRITIELPLLERNNDYACQSDGGHPHC